MIDRRTILAAAAGHLAIAGLPLRCGARAERHSAAYLRTNWSKDPFARGSYSYAAKAARARDWTALARPIAGRVFFAGEACHPAYRSTVHAAYESGLRAAAALRQTAHRRTGIIGAGISGLAAAQALAQAGRAVTIFEARSRTGGRVWTSDALGVPLDLGASWIHGTNGNPLSDLADALDLRRFVMAESHAVRNGQGRKLAGADQPEWLFAELELQASFGADADWLDPAARDGDDGYGGKDAAFAGGYAGILPALAGDYEVALSSAVSRVTIMVDGAALDAAGKGAWACDAAIVTVPLGVLQAGTIAFDPPLPAGKQAAIARLGMGVLDKLYLRFDDVFWDDATWIYTPDTGLARGQFNLWLNLHPFVGAPVLAAFNAGSAALALAQLGDDALVEAALGVLARAYPG